MTETAAQVLLVEAPGRFRDAVEQAVKARGAKARTADDGMAVLADMASLSPSIVVVGEAAGPPGPDSLCRILQRKFWDARVVRLADFREGLETDKAPAYVPRCLPAELLAARILDTEAPAHDESGFQMAIGPMQLGQVLLALCRRRSTGRLYVQAETVERRFDLVWGVPVASAGGGLAERLGTIAIEKSLTDEPTLFRALDFAQAWGMRLGQAFRRMDVLDGAGLFELLCSQHLRRIGSACTAGAASIRFTPGEVADVASTTAFMPVHPLMGLVHAFGGVQVDVRKSMVARLSSRELVRGYDTVEAYRLLDGLGYRAGRARLQVPTTVEALHRALASDSEGATGPDASALTLALIASGCVALGRGRVSSLPPHSTDPLRGFTGLSLLDEVPGETALSTAPADELEQALEAYLYRPRTDKWGEWLAGVTPQAWPTSELPGFYLDVMDARGPHQTVGVDTQASPANQRLALHRRLDSLDQVAPSGSESASVRVMRMQMRAAIDAASRQLPPLADDLLAEATKAIVPAAAAPTPASQVTDGARPAPAPPLAVPPANHQAMSAPPPVPGVPSEIETMVQQTRWGEVIKWVEAREEPVDKLSPGLALLYAVALKEHQEGEDQTAVSPDALGIRAVARMLRVGSSSPAALVIAKRTLRKRPLEWRQQPTKKVSVTAVLVALLVGATVGLFLQQLPLF